MFRSGKAKYFRKPERDCGCGHPQICHYTKDGHCIFEGGGVKCACQTFKAAGREEFNKIKKARCEYGHAHNSGLEIKICFDLHCLRQAGEIKSFEAEKKLDLYGFSRKKIVATYKCDFVVAHNDGSTEFIEGKGKHLTRSGSWAVKWSILQDMYEGDPKYKFRVVEG